MGAPAAPASRRGPLVLMAVLATLFFFATAAMTAVFMVNKSDSDDTIAKQKAEISHLREEAKQSETELAGAKDDLSTARSQAESLQDKVKEQASCIKSVQEFFAADSEDAAGRALVTMLAKCGDMEGNAEA